MFLIYYLNEVLGIFSHVQRLSGEISSKLWLISLRLIRG
jgi:hypothetical protein